LIFIKFQTFLILSHIIQETRNTSFHSFFLIFKYKKKYVIVLYFFIKDSYFFQKLFILAM